MILNQPTIYEVKRNLVPAFDTMNCFIKRIDTEAEMGYVLAEMFTTKDGSWELKSFGAYTIPRWARDAYLKPWGAPDYFDAAGGDHHIFVRVVDEDGNVLKRNIIYRTSDGQHTMIEDTGAKASGWTNLPIYNSFSTLKGENGGWEVSVNQSMAGEVFVGGGLPYNEHVSTFLVFQRRSIAPPPPPPQGEKVVRIKGTDGEIVLTIDAKYEVVVEEVA